MSTWYAVLCKPRRETVAEANLSNQRFEVYLPRCATQRRRDGKWVDVVEPLFPRYLFLAPSTGSQSVSPVRSTLGVVDFVRFGGQPAAVDESVIEALRERERSGADAGVRASPFAPGAPVRFADGLFKGLTGVFDMEAADERVYVLLDFLGKTNRLKVHRDSVVPVR